MLYTFVFILSVITFVRVKSSPLLFLVKIPKTKIFFVSVNIEIELTIKC